MTFETTPKPNWPPSPLMAKQTLVNAIKKKKVLSGTALAEDNGFY